MVPTCTRLPSGLPVLPSFYPSFQRRCITARRRVHTRCSHLLRGILANAASGGLPAARLGGRPTAGDEVGKEVRVTEGGVARFVALAADTEEMRPVAARPEYGHPVVYLGQWKESKWMLAPMLREVPPDACAIWLRVQRGRMFIVHAAVPATYLLPSSESTCGCSFRAHTPLVLFGFHANPLAAPHITILTAHDSLAPLGRRHLLGLPSTVWGGRAPLKTCRLFGAASSQRETLLLSTPPQLW